MDENEKQVILSIAGWLPKDITTSMLETERGPRPDEMLQTSWPASIVSGVLVVCLLRARQ